MDSMFEADSWYFIIMIVLGIIVVGTVFDVRKYNRTLKNVIIDCGIVLFLSWDYILGSLKIIPAFLIEIAFIIFFAIKIHKDDRIVDNCKVVKWWKRKQKERLGKQVQRIVERNRKT